MKNAFVFCLFLLGISWILWALIDHNKTTLLVLAFTYIGGLSYAKMKTFTYYTDVFVGIYCSTSILILNASIYGSIQKPSIFLFLAVGIYCMNIATVYDSQDIKEDERLGLFNMAVKWKDNLSRNISLLTYISHILWMCYAYTDSHSLLLSSFFVPVILMNQSQITKYFSQNNGKKGGYEFFCSTTRNVLIMISCQIVYQVAKSKLIE